MRKGNNIRKEFAGAVAAAGLLTVENNPPVPANSIGIAANLSANHSSTKN